MILDLTAGPYPTATLPWIGAGYIETWTQSASGIAPPGSGDLVGFMALMGVGQ